MGQADWPLILVRLGLYLTLAGLFGLAAFSLYGLKAGERATALALRPWLTGSAALALLLSLVAIVLMASAMAGAPTWPVNRTALDTLLSDTSIGRAWKGRMAALALALLAGWLAAGRAAWLAVVAVASGAALATLAWTGHGAMDEGSLGWLHLAADILHLIAAAVWLGALLGLILLVARSTSRVDTAHLILSHRALHGFSGIGTAVVGAIVVTGLVNGWLLVGPANVAALGATLYGELLIAKLVLFAAMLGLASLNRFRLTPRFERLIATADHRGALAALRGSLALEAACAVAILGLVAWLGTLEPPASAM